LGGTLVAEQRTPEQYTKQVETYLERAQQVYQTRASDEFADHPASVLRLRVKNETDRPFVAVQVIATFNSAAVRCPDPDEVEFRRRGRRDREELPPPPRLFGTPTVAVSAFVAMAPALRSISTAVALAASVHMAPDTAYVPLGLWRRSGWRVARTDDSSLQIVFDAVNLRAGQSRELNPVRLEVEAAPMTILQARWTATSTGCDGICEGAVELAVERSTVAVVADLSSQVL
jgi:hypothetical protein